MNTAAHNGPPCSCLALESTSVSAQQQSQAELVQNALTALDKEHL
jgi:hypothetical protein